VLYHHNTNFSSILKPFFWLTPRQFSDLNCLVKYFELLKATYLFSMQNCLMILQEKKKFNR
jgi:hypothetical protein